MSEATSKQLGKADESGFYFSQEMLSGDPTAAINFDRLQKHPEQGYIIFEYLLCEEEQMVNPHTSHPKRYWYKNKRKFISLWEVAQALSGTLYLVNYAKKGTKHEDKVRVIKVLGLNDDGITAEDSREIDRENFQSWFRDLNRECLV